MIINLFDGNLNLSTLKLTYVLELQIDERKEASNVILLVPSIGKDGNAKSHMKIIYVIS